MQTDFAPHVLLVDDDARTMETLSAILGMNGFICSTAADGFEALQSLLQSRFDIIITDLKVPKVSGGDLLRLVKRRFPQLGAVVISSESKTKALKMKVPTDAFFQKGAFTHAQLIATIRDILQRYRSIAPRKSSPWVRQSDGSKTQARAATAKSKGELSGGGKENGWRFTIQDEHFAGFRVRGLYDPEEQAWRVKTWPAGRFEPERDYWVQDGDLHTVRVSAPVLDQYWRRSAVGARNITVAPEERRAILHLIARWELDAVPRVAPSPDSRGAIRRAGRA